MAVAMAMSPAIAQGQPAGDGATVRVVHGLRGLVADIYVDGVLVLPTFQPERSTDPIPLDAGDHLVEIRTAGDPMSTDPLLAQTIAVPAGFVGSIVAHLDAAGNPTLTAFDDDLTRLAPGETRVVVRHTAAAGPVNVLIDDEPAVEGLAGPGEALALVPPGDHRLGFALATDGSLVGAPQRLTFAEGAAQFLYLIGSAEDGTLGWAAVQVAGLESAPTRVNTGDGSARPSDDASAVVPWVVLVALGFVGLAAVARSRRPEPSAS